MKNSKLSKEFLDQLSPKEALFICAWEDLYNDREFQSKLLCLKLEEFIAIKEEPYETIQIHR